MTTIDALTLFAVGMFLGAIFAFAFMFRLLIRSEKWLELRGNTMEVVLRDMYGHDMEELNATILRQHPN